MNPDDWQMCTIEDCCEILDSRRIPLNQDQRRERKGDIPYWGANGILDYVDDYLFDEPLILMAEDGGYFGEAKTRPICNLIDGKCWINNHAHVLRTKSGVLREWVYFWFVHRDITHYINGGTRSKLNQADLRKLPLAMPKFSEQKKITAILSSVDDAIQATQAVIDQTRRVKQGLMQQLLTRGIGHINLEKKEINQLPKDWKWVNLGDVTNESKQRNDGSFSDNDLYAVTKLNGLIPMRERVRGKNLDRCKVVLPTAFAYNPMRLNIGSIGQWSGDKPVIVSPDYVVFECDLSKIDSLYLNYIRKSHAWTQFIENAGKGSVRIRIYYKNLADFQFPLPTLLEQKQIVTILKGFDEVLKVEKKKFEQTLIIKHGLMQDLLTGRVRVKLTEEHTT
jgi:type I restriction enzyme S subunit